MLIISLIILAIHNFCFLRMQCQFILLHPAFQSCQQLFSFFFAIAMNDYIIRIPFKRILRMYFIHPFVKRSDADKYWQTAD